MLWKCNVDCVSHYQTEQKSSKIAARKSINIILWGNVNFHGIKRLIHKIYNKEGTRYQFAVKNEIMLHHIVCI